MFRSRYQGHGLGTCQLLQKNAIWLIELNTERIIINFSDLRLRSRRSNPFGHGWGHFFVEKNIFEVKHDVIGSKWDAVRPSDTFQQMKGEDAAIFVGLPFFG